MTRRSMIAALSLLPIFAATACHSAHVDVTLENRTGAQIRLIEVDYPSASFGVDAMAPGGDFHYRIQATGQGQVKVQYIDPTNHQVQVTGTKLALGDQGKLEIVLLPAGKAEFHLEFVQQK